MYKPRKERSNTKLYQVIGIALLCFAVLIPSYNFTSAWFLDESITSNGDPTILVVGTVDLDVKTDFNYFNLVLAPDTIYTTDTIDGNTVDYSTQIHTSEDNDVKTVYVRAKWTTNRSELTLYFTGNTTTVNSYTEATSKNKWYLHTDGYYYYIGEVGSTDIMFNAGYRVDNSLNNDVAKEEVEMEFVFETIQRPYGAYKAVWTTAPEVFNTFARQNTGY